MVISAVIVQKPYVVLWLDISVGHVLGMNVDKLFADLFHDIL